MKRKNEVLGPLRGSIERSITHKGVRPDGPPPGPRGIRVLRDHSVPAPDSHSVPASSDTGKGSGLSSQNNE